MLDQIRTATTNKERVSLTLKVVREHGGEDWDLIQETLMDTMEYENNEYSELMEYPLARFIANEEGEARAVYSFLFMDITGELVIKHYPSFREAFKLAKYQVPFDTFIAALTHLLDKEDSDKIYRIVCENGPRYFLGAIMNTIQNMADKSVSKTKPANRKWGRVL